MASQDAMEVSSTMSSVRPLTSNAHVTIPQVGPKLELNSSSSIKLTHESKQSKPQLVVIVPSIRSNISWNQKPVAKLSSNTRFIANAAPGSMSRQSRAHIIERIPLPILKPEPGQDSQLFLCALARCCSHVCNLCSADMMFFSAGLGQSRATTEEVV